jgi:hypothetical protein
MFSTEADEGLAEDPLQAIEPTVRRVSNPLETMRMVTLLAASCSGKGSARHRSSRYEDRLA